MAQCEKTVNLEPRFVPAYFYLGQAYEQKKMYAQAIATYQKRITQAERNPWLIAALGHGNLFLRVIRQFVLRCDSRSLGHAWCNEMPRVCLLQIWIACL
jgi:tetratricopeptide (TPR) repeat protein